MYVSIQKTLGLDFISSNPNITMKFIETNLEKINFYILSYNRLD